jgi:hypothetical protein
MAKAAKLEANAPRLRFAINPRPDGLVVKVDGVAVASNQDVRVDLGPHEVIATAPGFEGHASAPVDHERVVVDVILRMEAHAEPPAPEPAKTPEPAPAPMPAATQMTPAPAAATVSAELPRRGNRRRNGLISAATGAGLLAGAVVLLELSSSKYDDEHALCPRSMCKDLADLDQARSDQHQAQAFRGVSLGMGIGGTLLVATGAYLYFTSHDETPRVSVQAGRGSAGLSLNGRF